MRLSWIARGAVTAERNRAIMARTGYTMSGQKLWTSDEVEKLRRLYPKYTYKQLERFLVGRSYWAIRGKCQGLGIVPNRHIWTAAEISKLRHLFRTGTVADIKAEWPKRTYAHISRVANYHGIRRGRRPLKATGLPLIDQIRDRAYELGYSMPDLDEIAGTKTYFQVAQWNRGPVNQKAIARAVKALDGNLIAVWNDPED